LESNPKSSSLLSAANSGAENFSAIELTSDPYGLF